MKADRYNRLQGLIAEAKRKKELLDEHASRLTRKQGDHAEKAKNLQSLAKTDDVASIVSAAWDGLSATVQDEILKELTTQIASLDEVIEEEEASGWLMSKRLVGTRGIVLLALFAFAVTGSVLWVVSKTWKHAVQQPRVEEVVRAEKARLDGEIKELEKAGVGAQGKLESKKSELAAVTNLPELVLEAMPSQVPDEGVVLRMVIYMGMLGGCLHLLSSLVRYVGDRELRRSWLLYYAAVPIRGAGLALLIYLLLRVGVLAPSENGTGGIGQANLVGIYAFAGLTGMFAKGATEKLGEVFLTLFRTAKPAGDAVKESPKAKQG